MLRITAKCSYGTNTKFFLIVAFYHPPPPLNLGAFWAVPSCLSWYVHRT